MSLEKLSGLYYMKKLIGRDAQRIEDLRARLTSTTTNMNGMPGSPKSACSAGVMASLGAVVLVDREDLEAIVWNSGGPPHGGA